ncbi:MAG: proprotein convertase P-domain-containing protein, partial [Acidobacteriota bacterium]|nr:proprotein convertase P-domain-containing protein [Acidobacteriota bacterium]
VVGFSETFDNVTTPQLPQNWTAAVTGTGALPFATSTTNPSSAPNCIFTNNPATVSTSSIVSPVVRVGANSPKLIFRHLYNSENGFDGGVLEISVNGGAFQDIITAGGSFVTGGYNRMLSTCCFNPLPGRMAWSGNSVNYITTEVNLPPAAYRQQVQFRWRHGSDDTIGGTGWRIDNVLVTNAVTGENPTAIAFSNVGTASPYPSEIQISGLPGKVTKVSVNLSNFSHAAPDDVDLLLVSPSGRKVVLMSDVGGNNAVSNLSLSFEDIAQNSLPDNTPIVSGNYKPTDFDAGDAFPAPAPGGEPSGTRLSAFFNDQPNGTWKLFAVDDTGANAGDISGGWSLVIDTSTTAIGIPAVGASEPYPSEITISGQTGLVSKVTVGLENFSHSLPDDVDLLLVSPNGRKVVLMSDVGGATEANNVSLTFDDGAANSLPDNAALTSGSYKPTDFEANDAFPAPAPGGAPTGRMLSALNGSEPNGEWKLFLVDDNGNNTGTINAWSLNLQTSANAITIPENGSAQPYPSDLAITGQQGSVTKVTVTLNNFSHTAPDDADLMLVAPNGRRIVLMSDVGGNTEVGGLNLVFDDAAAANLPDSEPLVSGTFKPTNFETGDAFPAPAPSGTTGTTLNAFYGSAANGIWKLYVADDTGENSGSIAGSWSLNIQSSTSACLFSLSSSVQAFPVGGGSGGFNVLMPTGCPWTASSTSGFITLTVGSSGEGEGAVAFSVAPNMGPARTGTIVITNGSFARTFQVQQASGCPFSVNQSVMSFSSTGGTGNIQVSAGAECSWQTSANAGWIFVTSAPQSGNGTASFTVQPNPSANARTATITIGAQVVTINQAGAAGKRFDFDGDGRSDISVFRQGNWYLLQSTSGFTGTQFGLATDKLAPADYDGDRKTDIAVFREGNWYLLQSSNSAFRAQQFGSPGDKPVPSDYNGDGRAELAVYRNGDWHTLDLTNNQSTSVQFGNSTDKAVAADYDGDGKTDPAVYRDGVWYLLRSTQGFTSVQFGISTDKPITGDFDGDGKADQAVYRAAEGSWYINRSLDGQFTGIQFGISTDIPAAADYDGDGKTDIAVYRQGNWYILGSQSGGFTAAQFGLADDLPVPAAFVP